MASVPSVRPVAAPMPLERLDAPAAAFGSTVAAQGFEELASVSAKRADAFTQHAEQVQAINNKVVADQRAIDYSAASDALVADYRSNNLGMAAYDNMPEVYSKLEDLRAKSAQDLTPDAQVLYNSSSRAQLARAQSSIRDFGVTQRKASVVNTSQARIANAEDAAAGSEPGTPQFDAQLSTIAGEWAWRQLPGTMGLSPEEAEQGLRQSIGKVWTSKIRGAIDSGDYPSAQSTYDAHSDEMTLEQKVAVQGAMKVGANAFEANKVARDWPNITASAPGTAGSVDESRARTELEELFPGVKVTSGYRTTAHNAEVKGAANSYHTRGTGQAIDFVVPPSVTKEDVRTQLKLRGLPIVELLGPGDKGHSDHIHWAFGDGKPSARVAAVTPTSDPDRYLVENEKAAQAYVDTHYASNPTLGATVYNSIMAKVNTDARMLRIDANDRFDKLGTAVLQSDSASIAQLSTAYPGAASDMANLTLSQRRQLEVMFRANANELTPERKANLEGLDEMRKQNPAKFAKEDLSAHDLPANSILSLQKMQNTILAKGQKIAAADTLATKALASPLGRQTLLNLGIKSADPDGKYWQFSGALSTEIEAYAAAHGDKPPVPGSREMNNIINTVTNTVGAKPGWGWFHLGSDKGAPAFTSVPDAERRKIMDAASRAGRTLNFSQVTEIYQRAHPNGR